MHFTKLSGCRLIFEILEISCFSRKRTKLSKGFSLYKLFKNVFSFCNIEHELSVSSDIFQKSCEKNVQISTCGLTTVGLLLLIFETRKIYHCENALQDLVNILSIFQFQRQKCCEKLCLSVDFRGSKARILSKQCTFPVSVISPKHTYNTMPEFSSNPLQFGTQQSRGSQKVQIPWSNQRVTDRFSSKTATFRAICNSRAKRFRLRFFFALKISKVNLGGPHDPNHRETLGPKQLKVVA